MLLTGWLQGLDKRLSERENTLEAEIAAHRDGPLADAASREVTDRKDQAQAAAETCVSDAEMVRDLHELLDVKLARERIAAGSYGMCIACGAEIPSTRLQAQPTALRCLSCQAAQEPHPWAATAQPAPR